MIDAAGDSNSIVLRAGRDQALRLAVIEVPTTVDYPLYRK